MLEASATAAAWRRPRSGSCPGTGRCLTSADPVERGPAPLRPLRRPHGPTSPPGPTFRSCSPDRADSCRPLDRLGRYESDCTARGCLAPLSRSPNSLQVPEAHTSLELELAIKAAGGARRRPRHFRQHSAERPQPATGQPLPRGERLPAGPRAGRGRPRPRGRGRAAAGRQAVGHPPRRPQSCLRPVGLPALARRVGWQPSRIGWTYSCSAPIGAVSQVVGRLSWAPSPTGWERQGGAIIDF
jgi:hypothetical protein